MKCTNLWAYMRIRDITEGDKQAITRWTLTPEVFYEAGRKAQVVEDSDGNPVFYALKTEVKRMDILFNPTVTTPLTTAKAMKMLAEDIDKEPVELVTESVFPPLIGFMEKIGFQAAPQTFVRKK